MDQNGVNLLVSGIKFGMTFGVLMFAPLMAVRILVKFFHHVAS